MFKERGDVPIGFQLVLAFGESVSLILVDVVADLDAALPQSLDDLVTFRFDDARVIGALNDEERRGDLIDIGYRRPLHQEIGFRFRVADPLRHQSAPGWRDCLGEGHQIRGADDIDRGRPVFGQAAHARQCREPAERPAEDGDAIDINPITISQIPNRRFKILELVPAPIPMDQCLIALAIPGGTSDVRGKNGDSSTGEVLIEAGVQISRSLLGLRAAVDREHDGQFARHPGRSVEKCRDLTAVQGWVTDQFWRRQIAFVDPAKKPVRDLGGSTGCQVDDEDLLGVTCLLPQDAEPVTCRREHQRVERACGEIDANRIVTGGQIPNQEL